MTSQTSQPGKPLEEKKSKWRLFGKSTNKSTERLAEATQKRSDDSATSNESHRSSATDDSGSIVRGSVYNNQPEAHMPKPAEQRSLTADRIGNPGSRINGTLHKTSPVEVHPGMMTTQSGVVIEKVFQPQSVLSSSSTPSVRQETYTDPITGEVTTKTITTVVTETTTTQITKPALSPRHDDLDVEEERRLAAEFLAASASRQPQPAHHGLQPPPRTRGSLKQGKPPIAIPVHDTMVTDAQRPLHTSPKREQVGRQSSDYERLSWDRHSSDVEKHLPQLRPDYIDPTQSAQHVPQKDQYQQPVKAMGTIQRQTPETHIHSQSTYGNKITTPTMLERQASVAGVPRSMPNSHGLTPPLEEQEQREDMSTKRESRSSFGKDRSNDQDSFGMKVNHHTEHTLNGNRNGGKNGDQTRLKNNDMARTGLVGNYENERIGLGGGRR